MSDTPPPSSSSADDAEIPTPCWHCLTGEGDHEEAWHWSLRVGIGAPVIALARDDKTRLCIEISDEQLEMLMDGPVTLQGVLKDGI